MVKMARPRVRTVSVAIARPLPKKAEPFYLSPEWRQLVDDIKVERGCRCEDPDHDPKRPREGRVIGDHIVEIQDGGARLDRANVMLRCWPCHGRKTAAERRRRAEAAATRGGIGSLEGQETFNRRRSHAEIFQDRSAPAIPEPENS